MVGSSERVDGITEDANRGLRYRVPCAIGLGVLVLGCVAYMGYSIPRPMNAEEIHAVSVHDVLCAEAGRSADIEINLKDRESQNPFYVSFYRSSGEPVSVRFSLLANVNGAKRMVETRTVDMEEVVPPGTPEGLQAGRRLAGAHWLLGLKDLGKGVYSEMQSVGASNSICEELMLEVTEASVDLPDTTEELKGIVLDICESTRGDLVDEDRTSCEEFVNKPADFWERATEAGVDKLCETLMNFISKAMSKVKESVRQRIKQRMRKYGRSGKAATKRIEKTGSAGKAKVGAGKPKPAGSRRRFSFSRRRSSGGSRRRFSFSRRRSGGGGRRRFFSKGRRLSIGSPGVSGRRLEEVPGLPVTIRKRRSIGTGENASAEVLGCDAETDARFHCSDDNEGNATTCICQWLPGAEALSIVDVPDMEVTTKDYKTTSFFIRVDQIQGDQFTKETFCNQPAQSTQPGLFVGLTEKLVSPGRAD